MDLTQFVLTLLRHHSHRKYQNYTTVVTSLNVLENVEKNLNCSLVEC